MMKKYKITALYSLFAIVALGQTLTHINQEFELNNVKASVVKMRGQKVLNMERDLEALTFDKDNIVSTVDEPTYAKLKGVNFEHGIIEVQVLSRLLDSAPDS